MTDREFSRTDSRQWSRRTGFTLSVLGLLTMSWYGFVNMPTLITAPTPVRSNQWQASGVHSGNAVVVDETNLSEAQLAILFVGNSHTSFHDLKGLVTKLIDHRFQPGHAVSGPCATGFLDEAANHRDLLEQIESGESAEVFATCRDPVATAAQWELFIETTSAIQAEREGN